MDHLLVRIGRVARVVWIQLPMEGVVGNVGTDGVQTAPIADNVLEKLRCQKGIGSLPRRALICLVVSYL